MVARLRSLAATALGQPGLVWLVIRSYVLLVLMRAVITVFPLRRIVRHLGTPMAETSHAALPPADERFARRVGGVISRTAPYTPTDSNCYPQALTARWLLKRRGIPTTIYYGAAFEPSGERLAAHVWLRAGRIVVTGGRTGRDFQPLSMFADAAD
jgi:hypothetical protein